MEIETQPVNQIKQSSFHNQAAPLPIYTTEQGHSVRPPTEVLSPPSGPNTSAPLGADIPLPIGSVELFDGWTLWFE